MPVVATQNEILQTVRRFNKAAAGFDPRVKLPKGFLEFVPPLHHELTPRQQSFIAKRAEILAASHESRKPDYLPPSEARIGDWKIQIPAWCVDQRNQITGPADDAELVVKMLNSGAPGCSILKTR
jgi:malate synthase